MKKSIQIKPIFKDLKSSIKAKHAFSISCLLNKVRISLKPKKLKSSLKYKSPKQKMSLLTQNTLNFRSILSQGYLTNQSQSQSIITQLNSTVQCTQMSYTSFTLNTRKQCTRRTETRSSLEDLSAQARCMIPPILKTKLG